MHHRRRQLRAVALHAVLHGGARQGRDVRSSSARGAWRAPHRQRCEQMLADVSRLTKTSPTAKGPQPTNSLLRRYSATTRDSLAIPNAWARRGNIFIRVEDMPD